MKVTKSSMKNILLIILACFAILPFILILLNVNTNLESFSSMAEGGYDTTIQGVDISGKTLQSGGNTYTGLSGENIYCIGGKIECPDIIQEEPDPSDPTKKIQTTISFEIVGDGQDALGIKLKKCVNRSNPDDICMNAIRCNGVLGDGLADVGERSQIDFKDENGIKTLKQFNFSGTNVADDSYLNNFTEPYKSTPLKIDGEFVYLYNKNTSTIDSSYSACYLYDDVMACSTSGGSGAPASEAIKCVAHYGTNVGEKVCCDQDSILQKNGRVCPKELPRCVGYKCGEKWGTCFEAEESD